MNRRERNRGWREAIAARLHASASTFLALPGSVIELVARSRNQLLDPIVMTK